MRTFKDAAPTARPIPKSIQRAPQNWTADEFFAENNGLPHRIELADGMLGPFDDDGIRTLLANWGVDRVIALTGAEIWREALAAFETRAPQNENL